jgi:DNA-binding response OmpR family regulator
VSASSGEKSVNPIQVLLVEDNPADVRLIQEQLSRPSPDRFALHVATRLSVASLRLQQNHYDVILLDLELPDSRGLETFERMMGYAPEIPIIIFTENDDEALSIQMVHAGAQDYLVKGMLTAGLLARSIYYAIERHRLRQELQRARMKEQHDREISELKRLSTPASSAITAQFYGNLPLRESAPGSYQTFVERYGEILDLALEQRAYKVQHPLTDRLRALAEDLGFMRAGPRDAIEIHTAALQRRLAGVTLQKAQVYAEEGRLLALELMGHLAAFYRNYFPGARRRET